MSAKEKQRRYFVEKRVRALALMLLTRRDDLLIEEVKDDIGLDFIVRFHTKGKEGLREFGIKLGGGWSAVSEEQIGLLVRPTVKELNRYGPFLRPVCLFLFTMENDDGWYAWVAEPIETEDGQVLLRYGDEPACQPLHKGTLKDIIERVDGWYDAMFANLLVNGPGGAKTHGKRAKHGQGNTP
jgi:hypothetical protein